MLVRNIINYFSGYVNIRVEGFYIERFINLCISKKILLIDIRRDKATIMYADVGIKDYKKLKQIAKKTQSKIKIQEKKGLPFTAHKYRKRKIFGALILAIFIGIIVVSNYIWNIEIIGNNKISKEEIIKNLSENGLAVGINKNNLDTNTVINRIRLNMEDIAWIGITVKGTNAIVTIKEAEKPPEVLKEDLYCNIVSDKTGMITKINVQNGTANVRVGDIVEPGEILVNGMLEGKYTGTRYVHSVASIEAKIWHTKKEKAMLKQQIPVKTGNTEKKYSIKFKKNQINLFKTLSKFQKYDTINESKKITLFSNFYLPIELIKCTNKEYVMQEKVYSEDELVKQLTEKLQNELMEEIANKSNIINTNVNTYLKDDSVEVEVIFEVLENIGIEQEIKE